MKIGSDVEVVAGWLPFIKYHKSLPVATAREQCDMPTYKAVDSCYTPLARRRPNWSSSDLIRKYRPVGSTWLHMARYVSWDRMTHSETSDSVVQRLTTKQTITIKDISRAYCNTFQRDSNTNIWHHPLLYTFHIVWVRDLTEPW